MTETRREKSPEEEQAELRGYAQESIREIREVSPAIQSVIGRTTAEDTMRVLSRVQNLLASESAVSLNAALTLEGLAVQSQELTTPEGKRSRTTGELISHQKEMESYLRYLQDLENEMQKAGF